MIIYNSLIVIKLAGFLTLAYLPLEGVVDERFESIWSKWS